MKKATIPYVSIIGASYSGSTLLAFLLNAHPQIVSISEMGLARGVVAEKYRCSCGALLLQCPFFLELERRINGLGSTFSLRGWQTEFWLSKYRPLNIFLARPLRNVFLERIRDRLVPFVPGYRQAIAIISQRIAHFAQAALEITSKEVFADAKKDSMRIKFLRDIEQLDLKVIHLVRDVRGATASIMKYKGKDASWATRAWYNANMNAERARRYVSSHQWLRLRYDDLCENPQGTMDCISDFVGIRHAPIPKDFYKTEHHIIGNHMRLNKAQGVVRRDESWKDRLSAHDLDIIARLGGTANQYFGHDWP